eukprot:15478469-Alexandrium_andersonii.AAC.1
MKIITTAPSGGAFGDLLPNGPSIRGMAGPGPQITGAFGDLLPNCPPPATNNENRASRQPSTTEAFHDLACTHYQHTLPLILIHDTRFKYGA